MAKGKKGTARQILFLISPVSSWLIVFFILPVGILFIYSLWRYVPGEGMQPTLTLENYLRLLGEWYYIKVLLRTLWLGCQVTFLSLLLGFPLAFILTRVSPLLRSLLYILVLAPLMTSAVVRTFGWMILLGENGFINSCIIALGLTSKPIKFMYSNTAIVIALCEVLMPFMVLSLESVLSGINRSLYEAARNLGSKGVRIFFTVTLPLSVPGIAAGSILVFSLAISAFVTPALMGGASVVVVPTLIYDQALNLFNWPFGSAISFSLLFIILVILYCYVKLLRLGKLSDILR